VKICQQLQYDISHHYLSTFSYTVNAVISKIMHRRTSHMGLQHPQIANAIFMGNLQIYRTTASSQKWKNN